MRNNMKITTSQLRKIIKEEISVIRKNYINESLQSKVEALDNAMKDFLNEFPADEKDYACEQLMNLAQGACDLLNQESISIDDIVVDPSSLNNEQKNFLNNLLKMSVEQLATQYSDITGEKYGRSSIIYSDPGEEEIIKMILEVAYPELELK